MYRLRQSIPSSILRSILESDNIQPYYGTIIAHFDPDLPSFEAQIDPSTATESHRFPLSAGHQRNGIQPQVANNNDQDHDNSQNFCIPKQ